jgi:hypothetical protein
MEEGRMKRLIIAIVLVLAVSCLIFGQAKKQTQATSAEEELIQVQKEVTEAINKGDVATVDRIVSDDSAGTDEEGNVGNKTKLLADLKSGAITMTSVVWDDVKARVWGDRGLFGRASLKKAR